MSLSILSSSNEMTIDLCRWAINILLWHVQYSQVFRYYGYNQKCVKYVLFHDVQEINYASHFLLRERIVKCILFPFHCNFFFLHVELDCNTMMIKYMHSFTFLSSSFKLTYKFLLKVLLSLYMYHDTAAAETLLCAK